MSSYTNKTYIVFLDLPEQVSTEIDKIRQKYTPKNFKKWKAHITLKQDEDYLANQEEIKKIVSGFSKTMKPVVFEFNGIQMSELKGVGCNIYISIKDNPLLIENIKRLSQSMETVIDPDSPKAFGSTRWEQSKDFYPHISLKGTADINKGEVLLKEIRSEKIILNPKVICQTITLANWKDDHWEPVATYKLT